MSAAESGLDDSDLNAGAEGSSKRPQPKRGHYAFPSLAKVCVLVSAYAAHFTTEYSLLLILNCFVM